MKQSDFKLPLSYYRPIAHLSDEQLGRLFRAIYLYQLGSETEVADDIRVAYLFFITRFNPTSGKYDQSDRTEVSDKSDPEGPSDESNASGNTAVTNAVTHRRVTIRENHRQPCLSTGRLRIMPGGQDLMLTPGVRLKPNAGGIGQKHTKAGSESRINLLRGKPRIRSPAEAAMGTD